MTPRSPYASYFNIEWHPVMAHGAREHKVLLPVLGGPYGEVLENQGLSLGLDDEGFFVFYSELRLPLDPTSYGMVLAGLGPEAPPTALQSILDRIRRLPLRTATDPPAILARRSEKEILKQTIWSIYQTLVGAGPLHPREVPAFRKDSGATW